MNIEKYDSVKILDGEYIGQDAIVIQVIKSDILIVSVLVEGIPSIRLAKKHLELVRKYNISDNCWNNNASEV